MRGPPHPTAGSAPDDPRRGPPRPPQPGQRSPARPGGCSPGTGSPLPGPEDRADALLVEQPQLAHARGVDDQASPGEQEELAVRGTNGEPTGNQRGRSCYLADLLGGVAIFCSSSTNSMLTDIRSPTAVNGSRSPVPDTSTASALGRASSIRSYMS